MAFDLYCPTCDGAAVVVSAEVNRRTVRALICTECALVSEISSRGQLVDLGAIAIADCLAPLSEARVLACGPVTTALYEGRDS